MRDIAGLFKERTIPHAKISCQGKIDGLGVWAGYPKEKP
jgi:hypothetical protein